MPVASAGANPHTGTVDTLEFVEELRVEILCVGMNVARNSVEALKRYNDIISQTKFIDDYRSHPYETVAYEVYKLEDL